MHTAETEKKREVVSRIYLAQGGAADVDTYITLGTPFYGAPKV